MDRPEIQIEIVDRQTEYIVDSRRICEVIEQVLAEERISCAEISVALVDDAAIHQVNREFLGHDYPTDVISFLLSPGPYREKSDEGSDAQTCLEAELVISTETACREAAAHGWSAADEMLLYIVHGVLHLCGYDDLTDEARPVMRARERQFLAQWKLTPSGLEA